MKVFETLTIFIIISISIIVKTYAARFYLSAMGTPKCLFKKKILPSQNIVIVQLGINGSAKHVTHKTVKCGEKVTDTGYFDSTTINSGKIYVNYFYKKLGGTLTYKIPDDCQTPGGYAFTRRSYICNFKSHNDLLNEEFCSRFFGFVTGCYSSY
uniref:ZP domain-containing protein n=1 Tax=Strongyloides papillosus TaxID=174720 RepID=A0A0N5BHS2_STREA